MLLLFRLIVKGNNSKTYFLLIVTFFALMALTLASQAEVISLGLLLDVMQEDPTRTGIQNASTKIPLFLQNFISTQESEHFINNILSSIKAFFGLHKISNLIGIILIVALFKSFSIFFSKYAAAIISIRVSKHLRINYFEHIQKLPMSFFQKYHVGNISTRATSDAATIATSIIAFIVNYLQVPFLILTTLSICIVLSWQLSLILILIFPLVIIPIIYIAKHVRRISRNIQKKQESFASILIDFLSGIQTIKIHRMEAYTQQQFDDKNSVLARQQEKSARYLLSARPILHLVGGLGLATVLFMGLYVLNMPLSHLIIFCGIISQVYEPIKRFSEENSKIQVGIAAAERMQEVLSLPINTHSKEEKYAKRSFNNEIEFKNVSFAYTDDGPTVLKDISFKVKKGQTIAIVGPSGCGKSTLVQLIPKLFQIREGQILIDNIPYSKIKLESIRDLISFIPQKPFLFNDTIANNITCGISSPDLDKMHLAAEQSHSTDFILKFPQNYQTCLLEQGKNLSGGQQQRLAIARALFKNAKILIMDEATSSLDYISELKIQEAIESLKGKLTQIIIAHRLNTIEHADYVIYMEKGRIVQQGTLDSIIKQCPNFSTLWELRH